VAKKVNQPPLDPGRIALALLRNSDAINDELLDRLTEDGWPRLTRNQSQVFANLDKDGTTASELARRIGITRQSMQKLLEAMMSMNLLDVVQHPQDARSSLVLITPFGLKMVSAARTHLVALEAVLEERIGANLMTQLRKALAQDWRSFFLDEPTE
jgi:DNA-binding MarR family transcriptional regulator